MTISNDDELQALKEIGGIVARALAAMGKAIDMGGPRLAAMGQAAANRARRLYSVDAMCEATLDAYARVLAARHSGSHG